MTEHCYIGTKPCGCTVAAVVDDGKWPEVTAQAVKDFVLDGLTVSRVPISEFNLKRCRCVKKEGK